MAGYMGREIRSSSHSARISNGLDTARLNADNIFGCMRGRIEIAGDIEAPLVPWYEWEAMRLLPEDRDDRTE